LSSAIASSRAEAFRLEAIGNPPTPTATRIELEDDLVLITDSLRKARSAGERRA
jgi:hypothetical protein